MPIGAHVIKDRNPIGKFKISPKHKGIVTIIIGCQGIIKQNTCIYSETLLELITRQVFIFNLEDNKNYYLQILARIGKHNINITHYYSKDFIYFKNKLKKNVQVDLSSFVFTKKELTNPENFRLI